MTEEDAVSGHLNSCYLMFPIFFLLIYSSCSDKKNDMALIPEGEFIMGSDKGSGDETPTRKVDLKSYFIDNIAVTNEHYKKFIEDTAYIEPKGWTFTGYTQDIKDHPIVFINYDDALSYCQWKGKRLPTEEEWEKAARGTDGRIYPWGNHFNKRWANTSLSGIVGSISVYTYEEGKSPYGLYNMAGNVWEWTNTVGKKKDRRVVKGGSWGLSHRFSRTFSRVEYSVKDKTNNIGFRCAVNY